MVSERSQTKWIHANEFGEINKLLLKFIWRGKRFRYFSTVLKEMNTTGGLTLSKFKTYYKVIIIKTDWYQ